MYIPKLTNMDSYGSSIVVSARHPQDQFFVPVPIHVTKYSRISSVIQESNVLPFCCLNKLFITLINCMLISRTTVLSP